MEQFRHPTHNYHLQCQNGNHTCIHLHTYLGTRSSPKMTVVTNDLEYITAFWLQKETGNSEQQVVTSAWLCYNLQLNNARPKLKLKCSCTSIVHQVDWRHSSAHCCMCSSKGVPQWQQSQLPNCDQWGLVCNSEKSKHFIFLCKHQIPTGCMQATMKTVSTPSNNSNAVGSHQLKERLQIGKYT